MFPMHPITMDNDLIIERQEFPPWWGGLGIQMRQLGSPQTYGFVFQPGAGSLRIRHCCRVVWLRFSLGPRELPHNVGLAIVFKVNLQIDRYRYRNRFLHFSYQWVLFAGLKLNHIIFSCQVQNFKAWPQVLNVCSWVYDDEEVSVPDTTL